MKFRVNRADLSPTRMQDADVALVKHTSLNGNGVPMESDEEKQLSLSQNNNTKSPGDLINRPDSTGGGDGSTLSSVIITQDSIDEGSRSNFDVACSVAERGRKYAKRQRRRLVFKDGNCNVSSRNVTQRKRRYLVDLFTTVVDMRWRYNVILFAAAFVVSWLLFSLVWWVMAVVNEDHLHPDEPEWKSCAANVHDFVTALLFSVETQHTIGYGFRVMTPHCPVAIIVLMIQSCVGVLIQSLITGIVFAKLSRPKSRAQTIMFSRHAVICLRDAEYCLLFRVGDMRKSHIVGTSIRVLMVRNRLTREGESIPLCQYPLNVETETSNTDSFLFMVWPVTVVHKINEQSPLWNVSAEQMLAESFEIIVILEGTVESNGKLTQVRTSYLPGEILWGHRLTPLLTFQKADGHYEIDYSQFHDTIPMHMPDCSAAEHSLHHTESTDLDDEDYPVNFTAPAIRERAEPSTDSPRVMLFRRLRDGLRAGRAGEEGRHIGAGRWRGGCRGGKNRQSKSVSADHLCTVACVGADTTGVAQIDEKNVEEEHQDPKVTCPT